MFGQPAYQRSLFPAAFRLQQLDSRQDAAVLVLPAATSCQQLFQHQGAVAYFLLVPAQSAEVVYGSQHGSGQHRAGTQSRSGRYGRQQGHFQSAAEGLQLFLQRGIPFAAEVRVESRQRQGRLGDGERRSHHVEVSEFLVGGDRFRSSQVDGTQDDTILFLVRFDVYLQGRLSVQGNGQVDHVSSLVQAVGRRVRPSACQVDPYRASSPDNLVGVDRQVWRLAVIGLLQQSLAHLPEGPCLLFVRGFRLPFQFQGT